MRRYKWHKKVLVRDNYTCQKCKKRSGKLECHHIENFSPNKELQLEVNNGITLHDSCHEEFHKIYGKKDNNKFQIEEFINGKT